MICDQSTMRTSAGVACLGLIYIVAQLWFIGDRMQPDIPGPPPVESEHLTTLMDALSFMDHIYPPAFDPASHEPSCTRTPLPSLDYFSGERTYHHFDDVLLIVFFSHARYDVNLDYYRETYAEFFPNVSSNIRVRRASF